MSGGESPARAKYQVFGVAVPPVVLIFAAALALRIAGVGVLPGGDQEITVEMVQRFGPVEMLWSIPRVQPHFPLYYVFLDFWTGLFPIETARYVSVVAGAAIPAIGYYWFQSLIDEWRATRAAALLVIAPPLVVQSRWLRMYALLTLAVLLSWWAAWRWLHDDGRLATYGVVALVTVGLHPFGIAVVVAQLAWLSIEQYYTEWRPWFRPTVAAIVAVGSVGVLWLLARIIGIRGTGTIGATSMHMQYPSVPVQRAVVLPLTTLTGTIIGVGVLAVVLFLACVCGLWVARSRPWESKRGRMWLCWIGISLAVLYFGQLIRPIIMLKYVAWMAPAVALGIVDIAPETWTGDDVFYAIMGIAGVNLILAALLKMRVAIVAILDAGVSVAL